MTTPELPLYTNVRTGQPGPIDSSFLTFTDGSIPGSALDLDSLSNYLTSDVSLTDNSSFFDGPMVAQGTSGLWFVCSSVTVLDTVGQAGFAFKLWDGVSKVISSTNCVTQGAGLSIAVTLSGLITNPGGNLRMSVRDNSRGDGLIKANQSGIGNTDSGIAVFRIG